MSGTKGALIDAETLVANNYKIGVKAFFTGSSTLYIDDQIKHINDDHTYTPTVPTGATNTWTSAGHWEPVDNHVYYWPKANPLDFWAWTPYETIDAASDNETDDAAVKITNFTVDGANGKITFGYDLGSTDATAQPDLMFANTNGLTKENVSNKNSYGCVPLDFKHALAAIQFKVVSTKGAKINYIKLVDVAKEGACSFQNNTFAWDLGEPVKTSSYNHDFNANVTAGTESNFYASGSANADANFMMIPQKLGTQKIEISISIDANSAPEIFTGLIPSTGDIKAWQDGKIYVYTINIDENVNVNITDEVTSSNVKQKIEIRNTGNTKVYLRAAIFGNWKDANGKIINEIWNGTGTWTAKTPSGSDIPASEIGTYFYTGLGGKKDIGTGWVRGTDGYYYYKYQVPAGEMTVGTLFDTYSPVIDGEDLTPKNTHLELSVAVQAIQANLLVQTDGITMKAEASAYGWKTSVLSPKVDSLNNFTSGN